MESFLHRNRQDPICSLSRIASLCMPVEVEDVLADISKKGTHLLQQYPHKSTFCKTISSSSGAMCVPVSRQQMPTQPPLQRHCSRRAPLNSVWQAQFITPLLCMKENKGRKLCMHFAHEVMICSVLDHIISSVIDEEVKLFLAQEDATCGSSTGCCLLVHKASYAFEQVHTATEKAALAAEAAPAETLAEEPAAAASALALEAARPAPMSADRACDLPAARPALETTSEEISLMH
jgi:hypothetical protein